VTDADALPAAERCRELVNAAGTRGRFEVTEAAAERGASTRMIRKDLDAREPQGLPRRVPGGALPMPTTAFEPDAPNRTGSLQQGRRTAVRAVAEAPEDGAVLIGAGSTAQISAESLRGRVGLQTATNALTVAGILARRTRAGRPALDGSVRPDRLPGACPQPRPVPDGRHGEVASVRANAASGSRGSCTPDSGEAAVGRGMTGNPEWVALLVGHPELARSSLVTYADLAEAAPVVTGVEIADKRRAALVDAGVETEPA